MCCGTFIRRVSKNISMGLSLFRLIFGSGDQTNPLSSLSNVLHCSKIGSSRLLRLKIIFQQLTAYREGHIRFLNSGYCNQRRLDESVSFILNRNGEGGLGGTTTCTVDRRHAPAIMMFAKTWDANEALSLVVRHEHHT